MENIKGEFFYMYPRMHLSPSMVLKPLSALIFIQGTIADALVLVREHQAEAIGCATVAGFILFRGTLLFF